MTHGLGWALISVVLAAGCAGRTSASDGDDDDTGGPGSDTEAGAEATAATGGDDGPPVDACLPVADDAPTISEAEMASSMAAIFCIAQVDCDCPDRSHEGTDSCRHASNMDYERLREDAQALGLTYDGACLGQLEAAVEALGCEADPGDAYAAILGEGRCSVYHGDLGVGEACTNLDNIATDCAQGLACWGGVCTEVCGDPYGGRRSPYGFSCPEGQRLGYTGSCGIPSPIGSDCGPQGCEDGAYCETTFLGPGCEEDCETYACAATLALGDACEVDAACGAGLCEAGVCVPAPVLGEACLGDRCGPDGICTEGACAPSPAICELVRAP